MTTRLFGHYRIARRDSEFALILPARFHRDTTFGWLRQFRSWLWQKPRYVLGQPGE